MGGIFFIQKSYPCFSTFEFIPVADNLYKTTGIVLKTVKYGDTSLIVAVFTELFGLQSYIISGVRSASKKGSSKASMFQPAAVLQLVAYHNPFKQLNRIKEFQWQHIYKNIFSSVLKNGVAMFMVEFLGKCLKEPEPNADLFAFVEDSLVHLDESEDAVMANFPLFFAINLCHFFGFEPRFSGNESLSAEEIVFDLQEGVFTPELPQHNLYLEKKYALITAELLKVKQPAELAEIRMNGEMRRKILDALEMYYSIHVADFGRLKTLPVLREIMR